MRYSIASVRAWELAGIEGSADPFRAASLSKPLLGHLALELIEDLDEPVATRSNDGPATTSTRSPAATCSRP